MPTDVTTTECDPMLVLEALALGIPAVTSATHSVYDSSPDLATVLVVARLDDSAAIARALVQAVNRRVELRPALRMLAAVHHTRASVAWCAMLTGALSPAVCDVADRLPPPLIPQSRWNGPLHIAMVALELVPLGPGGAGLVTAASALGAALAGHCVTIITLLDSADAASSEKWLLQQAAFVIARSGVATGRTAQSATRAVDSVCLRVAPIPDAAVDASGPPAASLRLNSHAHKPLGRFSELQWLKTSQILSAAVAAVHDAKPIDVLEGPDYGGALFDLLWARQSAGQSAHVPTPIPRHVPVIIRAHGTLQLIDQAAGVDAIAPPTSATRWERYQEQFALATADAVLFAEADTRDVFLRAYSIDNAAAVMAPIPASAVVALRAAAWLSVAPLPPSDDVWTTTCTGGVVVVPGRFHCAKGTLNALDAAKELLQREPSLCFEFAGGDATSIVEGTGGMTFAEAVAFRVPYFHHGRIRVTSAWSPSALPALVQRASVLLFLSRFETYGVLVRECLALAEGRPVVISTSAPGFRSLKSHPDVLLAYGTPTGIQEALTQALARAPVAGTRLSMRNLDIVLGNAETALRALADVYASLGDSTMMRGQRFYSSTRLLDSALSSWRPAHGELATPSVTGVTDSVANTATSIGFIDVSIDAVGRILLSSCSASSSASCSQSQLPTPTVSRTRSPQSPCSASISSSCSQSQLPTPSFSSTGSSTTSQMLSPTSSVTATKSQTPTRSASPTASGTLTSSQTSTRSATQSPSSSRTPSASQAATRSGTSTKSGSSTVTTSQTQAATPSSSQSKSETSTSSQSQTVTRSKTPSPSQSQSATESPSETATQSMTQTRTMSVSQSQLSTASQTASSSQTPTPSSSLSPRPTPPLTCFNGVQVRLFAFVVVVSRSLLFSLVFICNYAFFDHMYTAGRL
jgi:glycosyltransferase involved in cell wall biosynthesis